MVPSVTILKKSILLVGIMVSAALCQLREHWYLFRVEINATNRTEEIGCGAGIFWSFKELDEPPCNAFGVTTGINAIINKDGNIPSVRIGTNARWGVFCARIRYGLYKPRETSVVSVVNPQIGLSFQSIVSLYVGYNQMLFKRTLPGLGGMNISICMNMPSYCLKE
jgi:hypothetical protein